MERLRYVARSRGEDPAVLVGETAEAIVSLRPEAGELVMLCRRLVDRHPTCGPMWWFCASLLAEPNALDRAWDLAAEIEHDRTPEHLAHALAEGATVLTIGAPELVGAALVRRGDLTVLAVDAQDRADAMVRRCDRADVECHLVPAESALGAVADADVVLVEADACSPVGAIVDMGSGLVAALAATSGTPLWLIAGRGRRLPEPYRAAIERASAGPATWRSDVEVVAAAHIGRVVGPHGTTPMTPDALGAECPLISELVPPPT